MKKTTKMLALVLCALMLVVGSVMGTLAYLTADDSVKNTFTVGKVEITLKESVVDEYGVKGTGTTEEGNKYKLIPGHTYVKDPTITVGADSEDCWLFVKIEKGLGDDGSISGLVGWTIISENDTETIWAYDTVSKANDSVVVFNTFTFDKDAEPADYADKNITVTAYAIQADGLESMTPGQRWALITQ